MTDSANNPSANETQNAYRHGWRMGLATSALALSFISFLNLLGIEKSLLALLLGYFAMKGSALPHAIKRRGQFAMLIAVLHILTIAVVLAVFHEELAELIRLLEQLG